MNWLLALIDPIKAITDSLAKAYIAREVAVTDQEKTHADERVKTLEARRDVLVTEGRSPGNILVRAWLTFPPSFLVAKIMVWDLALGQWTRGHTDLFDANLWWLIIAVYGFYFLTAKK